MLFIHLYAVVSFGREHVRAFAFGDAWVVVGTSSDIVTLAATVSQARLITPASGTSLWADVFVLPSRIKGGYDAGDPSPLIHAWLDFILSPRRAATTTGLKRGLSPLLLPDPEEGGVCGSLHPDWGDINVELDVRGRFMPNRCILERSEFLLPLDRDTEELYNRVLQ